MDRKKKNIIILVCISVILILLCIFVFVDLFSFSSFDKLLINDVKDIKKSEEVSNKKENLDNVNQEKNDNNVSNDIEKNNNSSNDIEKDKNNYVQHDYNNIDTNNSNNDKIEEKNDEYKYSEDDVVTYFENMGDEIERSSSFKEKFKKYFIDIVDFIFYEKEVNGYTFGELGNMAKIKIISIALKIDSKIEEYVPNYKENISTTSSKIYNNIKEKLVTMYLDISTDICSGDNEKECAKVKEIFGEVKEGCKIGWSFIKSLVSNGVSKLREWYEIYSGK